MLWGWFVLSHILKLTKMKRRKFLIALGVVPPLILEACKGDQLPKTATIIKAKVTDDKGNLIENIPLKFYGFRDYGGNLAGGGGKIETTFTIEKSSDKQGNVEFSQIVPEITTYAYFSMGDTFTYYYFKIQAKKNNIIINDNDGPAIAVYPDSSKSIILGETNEYEIILTKK
jgi:hypothetical protein